MPNEFVTIPLGNRDVRIIKPFDDDEMEQYFERLVKDKIAILEEKFPDKYEPHIHDSMVIQLVKSEILIEKYEYLLLNDAETEVIIKLIKNERDNRNFLYTNLAITFKGKSSDSGETDMSLFNLG